MPARDGTGPFGTGPSGRGLGPCRDTVAGSVDDLPYGMGMAYRRGRGGWGRRPRWGRMPWTANDEQQVLKNQQSWLKEQLDAVKQRLEDLTRPSE